MKVLTYILILIVFIFGIFWLTVNEENVPIEAPAISDIQTEKETIEKYLRENINTLSPTSPVLGGMWYIVSVNIEVENNSGKVVYEDGHIQEEKNFTYILNEKGEVLNLIIK